VYSRDPIRRSLTALPTQAGKHGVLLHSSLTPIYNVPQHDTQLVTISNMPGQQMSILRPAWRNLAVSGRKLLYRSVRM
jgi:hypothetical protein